MFRLLPNTQNSDLPSFTVFSEGRAIPSEYRLFTLEVIHEVNRISAATLVFFDGDPATGKFSVSESGAFVPGKKVKIELGYHQNNRVVFEGVVVKQRLKIAGDESLVYVDCRDKCFVLAQGRKNSYFYDLKDSDIISQLVREKGLSSDIESTSVKYKQMVQYACSDWDFILSRAEANGKLVYTDAGKLVAKAPDSGSEALSVSYGITLLEADLELEGRTQYGGVKVSSWDPADQILQSQSGRSSGTVSPGNLSSSNLANEVGVADLELTHAGQLMSEELQQWANSELTRSKLAKIRGRIRIQGVNNIKPGQILKLDGLGTRFSGKAFISGVRHELNNQNWETDLSVGLDPDAFARKYEDIMPMPAEGLLPAVHGLHVGVVTRLTEDPDNEQRIKVRIPAIDMAGEGIWARLATLDAGKERGTFFRPEVGDEVILGFMHDDPRNPVILGQLHSSKNPVPVDLGPTENTNDKKGYVSRSKIKMVFNDKDKSYTLETPDGRKLTLDDTAKVVKMEDSAGNKITMDDSGITIETQKKLTLKASQDVQIEGMNVNIKASAQLKAQGSAGAELSASGNTVVKGAIVQIN